MIGKGTFQAQLAEIEKILSHLSVFEERVPAPNRSLGAAHFKGMSYRQVYEECVREYGYDFRLTDQSLLAFTTQGTNKHNGSLSFSYYECPFRAASYAAFLAEQFGVSTFDSEFPTLMAEWGDELRPDYEQYLDTLDSKAIVTPMRYDYKPVDYRAGVHPASHLHVGHENEIRIATRRVMNPISFVLLVLRQRYPQCWADFILNTDATRLCRNVRESLDKIHRNYHCDADLKELALH